MLSMSCAFGVRTQLLLEADIKPELPLLIRISHPAAWPNSWAVVSCLGVAVVADHFQVLFRLRGSPRANSHQLVVVKYQKSDSFQLAPSVDVEERNYTPTLV